MHKVEKQQKPKSQKSQSLTRGITYVRSPIPQSLKMMPLPLTPHLRTPFKARFLTFWVRGPNPAPRSATPLQMPAEAVQAGRLRVLERKCEEPGALVGNIGALTLRIGIWGI